MKIKINGEIGWDITANDFIAELESASGDIVLEISSPGGSVFQGIQIFNAIKAYDKGKVTAEIVSLAASIASYIALAADEVKAYDNSVYMIHNASVVAWGDHRDLRKSADIVEGLSKIIANAYISKTSKAKTEIQQLMDDETYLYGAEMQEVGFVDEIISTEDEKDKNSATALAHETFTATFKATNERYTKEDFEQAVAFLKEESKKIEKEETRVDANASKVNAIKARLNLKEKEVQNG